MLDDLRPGPPRVQIQTQSMCNGRCVFCPNQAVLEAGLPQGRMDPELFEKIIDELAETRPRRISLYLMNEPLLDARLPDFVRYAAERVPEATTLVTSNGTHLTEERGAALIEAGLKRIKVSLQSLDPETNMRIMGRACDSAKIVEHVLAFHRLKRRLGVKRPDLRVSMIVTKSNLGEIEQARRFWKKQGIRLVTSALENRGGNIKDVEGLNPHEMAGMERECIRPFREMCVLYNGDVVLCCVDWFRTEIVGNLAEQSLREVWNSPRLQTIRKAMRAGHCEAIPAICHNCAESASPDHHRRGLRGWLARTLGAPKKPPPCGPGAHGDAP